MSDAPAAPSTDPAHDPPGGPLGPEELRRIDAYWRAANYLSVGQIYLLDNPLLREPLAPEHVKPRLLGHWGTTPGLNFIYAHMNRVIRSWDLDAIYVIGPGPRRPGARRQRLPRGHLHARSTRASPATRRGCAGCSASSRSRAASRATSRPRRPGSIHEGGELGYALSHAYGAAFDNPDLVVCCVVGDGEAETGPLATSWHSNKFLDPVRDGAVLPILHLNGYKIANPTVLARIPRGRAASRCSRATATAVTSSRATTRPPCTSSWRPTLDEVLERDRRRSSGRAREARRDGRAPALADDRAAHAEGLDRPEGGRRPAGRGHLALAPGADRRGPRRTPSHLAAPRGVAAQLPARGAVRRRRRACVPSSPRCRPTGDRADERQPARQRRPAPARPRRCPTSATTPSTVDGARRDDRARRRASSATFLRDVIDRNRETFRLFGPDETASNRLGAVFEATDRAWDGRDPADRRAPRAATAGSWRSSPSTSARAGWRATC